jgi:pyridoxal phosphate enzyme (YggS family)
VTPSEDPTAADVAVRLEQLRERIAAAGGDPAQVTVVAVTKGLGPAAVAAATEAGLGDIGENYAQGLLAKRDALPPGITVRWHLIGPVQRNKVKALAPAVHLWQAVDRLAAGRAIAVHAPGAAVLVEVNTGGELSKAGCRPEEAAGLVEDLRALGLDVRGLMTVAPAGGPDAARPAFASLARLRARLGLRELSMGMTSDLDAAVAEGATIVRVGTALFGPRPVRSTPRRPGPATIG